MRYLFLYSVFLFIIFITTVPVVTFAADNALKFDGVNDYVDLGDDSSLDLGSFFEITLWAKFTGIESGIWIGSIDEDGDYDQYWYIQPSGNGSGRVEASLGDGTNYSQIFSNITINDNEWHKVLWTRSDDLQTIFIDGIDRTNVNYIDSGIGDVNSDKKTYIGGDLQSDDYYFNGSVDSVSIFTNGGTKGLWSFDEGSGAILGDTSGSSNNGSVSEAEWTRGVNFAETLAPTTGGLPAYRPEIAITFPQRGDVFSDTAEIKYEVTDKNDEDLQNDKKTLGLGETPVTLFYSTSTDIRRKILIAEDLPAVGTYNWDTSLLLGGDSYMVIIEAVDKQGESARKAAGPFHIDQTAPVFTIEATPSLSRGENVTIRVQSSKILAQEPAVFVTQQGFQPVQVDMIKEDDYFVGVYSVFADYDGTATIAVQGTDTVGNVSTTTVSGSTFSINVASPPKPIVIAPLNNEIVSTNSVTLRGRVRGDTDALLTVNGTEEYRTTPDALGNFVFENIAIDPEITRGVNILTVVAIDESNTVSEAETLQVTINKSPEIVIISPQKNDTLFGTTSIKIGVRDFNEDPVTVKLEASRDGGEFVVLTKSVRNDLFLWDTAKFPDSGHYRLRVTADDGFASSQILSDDFSVSNFQARVSFLEDVSYINTDTIEIRGTIEASARRGLRTIESVEYSIDTGVTWNSAQARDGAFESYIEDFVFALDNLTEKTHTVLVRGEDKRGPVGSAERKVVVDLTLPPRPLPLSPKNNSIVSDADDLNGDEAGVQIPFEGSAEANNTFRYDIELSVMGSNSLSPMLNTSSALWFNPPPSRGHCIFNSGGLLYKTERPVS